MRTTARKAPLLTQEPRRWGWKVVSGFLFIQKQLWEEGKHSTIVSTARVLCPASITQTAFRELKHWGDHNVLSAQQPPCTAAIHPLGSVQ